MHLPAFSAADRHAEQLAEILRSRNHEITEILVAMATEMGEGYSVRLRCEVGIKDAKRDRTITLLRSEWESDEGNEPGTIDEVIWENATSHRYLVNGEIQVVPHICCPICWQIWFSKEEDRQCPHCDAVFGESVKLLIDDHVCPSCEKGTVTPTKLKCDRCGYTVDPALVVWA